MAFVLRRATAVFWPRRKVAIEIDFCWCRLFCLYSLLLLPQPIRTHWLTLQAAQVRFPGCCQNAESFDCGDGHCLSVSRFHDGHPDCADGSDEFCLPGQIPCGQFCADPLHLGECLRNPNCTKKLGQENDGANLPSPPIFCPLLKRRLCGVLNTISCRGYGECIFVKWLMDGKRDCLDGSDEDLEYADLFKITPLRVDNNEPQKQHKGQSSYLPSPKLNEQNWSTKKPPQLPTIFPTKSIEIPTTIKPVHFWEWTEKTLIGSSVTTEIVPLKPNWEIGKGGGRENLGGKEGHPPFGIGISNPKEFEGHGVRVVESTEPGPWENPALDDFGGEFARYLITITQSTFTDKNEPTTESGKKLMTGAAGSGKAVDKSIVFPNWPKIEEENGKIQKEEEERNQIWPTPVLKEGIGSGGNLPFTTPKYPFDRGKIEEGELPSIWIPFSRPAGKTTTTMAHENVDTMKTTMKEEMSGKTTTPDVWLPEEGIGFKGKGMESEGRGNEEVGRESPEGVEEATTEKTEEREGQGGRITNEKEKGTIEIGNTTEKEKEEEFTTSTTSSSTLTRHSEEANSMQFATSQTTLPFGQTHQNGPAEMSVWSLPAVSPSLLSAISANLSATTFNCTERMVKMASHIYSSSSAVRCQCPKGQMPQIDGQCRPAPISTFRARLESICGLRLNEPSKVEEQLTLMKIAASFPNQPICVRAIIDGPGIVMNTICPSNCTLSELNDRLKSLDGILPEIKLKIAELSACGYSELNDCDEKAECIVHGLDYECQCLMGTNDTSGNGFTGRHCEGTVIRQNCIKLFGICLLVWLLLLLLLCFMLPILAFICFKYCCQNAPASEAVRIRWRWVKAKILGKEPTLLPIITTSSAPAALRRESGPSGLEFGHRADTLKVPSIIDGQKPYIPPPFRPQQSQAESEDYLILEDEEGGGEVEPEEETKRDSGEKGEEEESSGAKMSGKTTRQQTEQSTGTLPTQKSMEGEIVTVAQLPTEIKEESMPMPTEPKAIEQPKVEPSPPAEQQPRPSSVASRAGTPTIWDQFRILGDQYSRMGDIDERRESKTSLEELMEKAKERERAQKQTTEIVMEKDGENEELAETMKDDLDAELKMRGQKVEEEEGIIEEEEEEMKQKGRMKWRGGDQEPGRSIPAAMLPPGAVNIGFGGFIPDDIDIPSQPPRAPAIPPPHRQFVPKPFGARKSESRVSSGGTVVKAPSGERKMPKGEFVLIRGRTVEREEEKRRKMEGKRGEEKGLRDRRERMRRLKDQKSLDESLEEELDGIGEGKREFPRQIGGTGFDPDLPTTSQADPYWQRNLRKQHKKHSADFLRQKFRKDGKALKQIEEQIEEKVHEGCIVAGRKPWDVSPRMDGLDLMPPPRRELTQSDEAEMNRSQERLETKIHSGCITDRKPWDPSPFRERKEPKTIRHGHSEMELDGQKRIRRRMAKWERPNSLERETKEGRKRQQNWLDLD